MFPTMGRVFFDKNCSVIDFVGQGPVDPRLAGFEESVLRDALVSLDQVERLGPTYNPIAVIRAVNVLHMLGKERALQAAEEYLRLTNTVHDYDRSEGLSMVLRIAFDDGKLVYHDSLYPLWFRPSENRGRYPLFPIQMVGDIPFFVPIGVMGAYDGRISRQIDFYREHASMRLRPLTPVDDLRECMLKAIITSQEDKDVSHDQVRRHYLEQVDQILEVSFSADEFQKEIIDRYYEDGRPTPSLLMGLRLKWDDSSAKYIKAVKE
jgi:hypothetical protein